MQQQHGSLLHENELILQQQHDSLLHKNATNYATGA